VSITHKTLTICLLAAAAIALPGRADEVPDGPLWRAVTGGVAHLAPVVAGDGRVFVAAADRYLYAYSAAGGSLWRYDLRARPAGRMCAAGDGTVLLERTDGTLVSVNPAGKTVWSRGGGQAGAGPSAAGGDPAAAAPAVVQTPGPASIACGPGGILYRLEEEPALVALTPRGTELWRVRLESRAVAGPLRVGNTLVVALQTGSVIAVDRSGAGVWRYGAGAVTALGVAANGGVLVATADGAVVELSGGRVVSRWRIGKGPALSLVPAVGGPGRGAVAYARTLGGLVFALGREAAPPGARRLDTGGLEVVSIAARSPAGLFLLAADGGLWALEGAADEVLRMVAEPTPSPGGRRRSVGFTVSAAGRAVVTGPGWTVAVHRVDGRGLERPSPRGAAPPAAASSGAAEREIDRIYLSRMLGSDDGRDRDRVLAEIASRIDKAALLGSYEHVLDELTRFVQDGRRGPGERARAVRLLSRIGGYGTREVLLRLARGDAEREVRVAVLESIGNLSVDGTDRTARTVLEVLREEARGGADARLGRAGLSAVRGYVSYRGAVDRADLAEAIGFLATGGFPREIVREVSALARELY
jgi:hypothetical protein